ncbi:MAG: primosomal protein N' [Eubacteriales bacterium]
MFADIIVDITHEKLDRVFQYSIPSELEGVLKVGLEVIVPFGRGNRETKGYVIGFSETTTYDVSKIKSVLSISKTSTNIEGKLVALAAWMKESYGGTMIQSLKTVLPIKEKENEKQKRSVRMLLNPQEGREKLELYLHKNQKARARLIAALLDNPILDYEIIIKKLNITLNVVKALEEQGVLVIESEQVYRNPVKQQEVQGKNIEYTDEQQAAIQAFASSYGAGRRETFLIHGITGSGKTEVYIEMIDQVVKEGKQAIVLIPEISLTYQTVQRFYGRFGDRVSIMNSRLSKGERFDQWTRAKNGEIDVIIGPRSALFTPFPQVGIIVIDEEHEQTYKSEQIPRYHAREVAIERGKLEGASVVLGSATPSLESYYQGEMGTYHLLELKNRSRMQSLPQVHTVDLRAELKAGNRSIISDKLRKLIGDRLEKKEQIMLFLNRRGYVGFISCRSCGYVKKCPHCDVSLSEHKGNKMLCHYCGYEEEKAEICPSCGSKHIGGFRAGTQQIEELIHKEFPMAKTLRMDVDTTRQKDSYEKILKAFAGHEADILIGTQMIVKGHDFPNVTLVGILAADLSLHGNDYRAGERTFQLLTQAAGRAGRGTKEGEVVIQTYNPEHYSIVTASKQDYEAFYQEEIEYRSLMGYPPVEHLLGVLMQAKDADLLEVGAKYTSQFIKKIDKEQELTLIGPTTPSISKISDYYRKVIYIKSGNYDMLTGVKNKIEKYIEINSGFQNIRVQFDFNPMNIW